MILHTNLYEFYSFPWISSAVTCAKHQSDLKPNYFLAEIKNYCFQVRGANICFPSIINLQKREKEQEKTRTEELTAHLDPYGLLATS